MISIDEFETRAAVLEGRELVEIYIERRDQPSILGNIYLGRVRDILPGMQAAFIDIGLERTAFLYVEEVVLPHDDTDAPIPKIQYLLKTGQDVLVQVIKEPMGGKGARVTTQITLPGRYLVLLPFADFIGLSRRLPEGDKKRLKAIVQEIKPKNMGLIVRTAAKDANIVDLRKDLQRLRKAWRKIYHLSTTQPAISCLYKEPPLFLRIVRDLFTSEFRWLFVDDLDIYRRAVKYLKRVTPHLVSRVKLHKEALPLFEKYNIEKAIEAATKRRVWLRSGGYITIDQTEALTAIDVNTGKFVGKTSLEQTIFKTNLEAAEEIVRQLRLRDIGGIIVIDFIDMEDARNREEVFKLLTEQLERDRTKSRVIEISKLGLVEMTRKNVSYGLRDFLTDSCVFCLGTGRISSKEAAAIKVYRKAKKVALESAAEAVVVKINPLVRVFFEERKKLRKNSLRTDTGKYIYILDDESCPVGEISLIGEGTKKEMEHLIRRLNQSKEKGDKNLS
jgi:ribonuclease G